jgi:protein-tyrosine phosphatase
MLMPAALRTAIGRRYGTHRGLVRLLLAHAEFRAGRLAALERIDFRAIARLVFVCQGNICRSAFAHWYARSKGLACASVGFATAGDAPAHPAAIETARRFGIDLARHRTTDLEDFAFQPGDLALVMEIRQVERLEPSLAGRGAQLSLLGLWARPRRPHIHDPNHLSAEYFETCFRAIASAVDALEERMRSARAPGGAGVAPP